MNPALSDPGMLAGAPEDTNAMEGPAMPGEICVPLASLAEPDDQQQMTPPAVGDKGSANADYTVTRIAGENAYITLDALNGEKIENPAEDQGDHGNDEAGEEASLRQSLGGPGAGGYNQ